MGTVTGVAWTVTMATRITTATTGSSDRPGAKIFQLRNLPQDSGALLFQIGDRLRHKGPPNNRAYHIRSVIGATKRNLPKSYFHVAHPALTVAALLLTQIGNIHYASFFVPPPCCAPKPVPRRCSFGLCAVC